jgi:DNA-binding transcriptional ArsR family regulator
MNVDDVDLAAAAVAAAIGEPARARMLYALLDGRARTSTELATVADVTPSTGSVHLQRLKDTRLVRVVAQGKHRYYSLERTEVAAALEAIGVVAGRPAHGATSRTPHRLRVARTCYDHIAGHLGVALHDRFMTLGWLIAGEDGGSYDVSSAGRDALAALGIDVDVARGRRRRFAFACLDWSERRPHLGGALAAAVLDAALRKRWVSREPDGRALRVNPTGVRELRTRVGIAL